jgi:hypothetical protein
VLRERRHRAGDGVVEAKVERLEIVDRHGDVLLDCEPGDDLTEIPVVVDDLAHRESLLEALGAVHGRRGSDLQMIDRLLRRGLAQGLPELVQEGRQRLRELRLARDGRVSPPHSRSRASEDLVALRPDEVAELAGDDGLHLIRSPPAVISMSRLPRV